MKIAFKEHVNLGAANELGGAAAGWRWSLEVKRWSIWLQREWVHRGHEKSGWHPMSTNYFSICRTKWMWGQDHCYYDGPHCSFSVGPITFNWSYWWCEKCYSGEW